MPRTRLMLTLAIGLALTTGCKTSRVGDAVESAGKTVASGAKGVAGTATSLVNVNLSNVLNDLALDLKIDRANIPINAQIPITIAANVCGVSINILSVSTGGTANCTATSTSPALTQVVQQQLSTGGGTQATAPATTAPPTTNTTPETPPPQPTPQ